jgi:cytochrome c oxidase assembly protein subunit 15
MQESLSDTSYRSVLDRTRPLHRFILVAVGATLCLISWGGFVTSINAGLAVPDWPTSFNSWDPLNPIPEWWAQTPVLAEHGHRLLGALIGLLTIIVVVWTWRVDPRPGVRGLAAMALVVVIMQGVLGGLRVVFVSLNLAVVHALTAQIFLGLLVTLGVLTSRGWLERLEHVEPSRDRLQLARVTRVVALIIFAQIGLGTLLRHPGEGIDLALALIHIGGAVAVFASVVHLARLGLRKHRSDTRLRRGLMAIMFVLTLQIILGFTAYFVLLNEAGMVIPGNLQVFVNTLHVVVGALLWGTAVAVAVWSNAVPPNEELDAD